MKNTYKVEHWEGDNESKRSGKGDNIEEEVQRIDDDGRG